MTAVILYRPKSDTSMKQLLSLNEVLNFSWDRELDFELDMTTYVFHTLCVNTYAMCLSMSRDLKWHSSSIDFLNVYNPFKQ